MSNLMAKHSILPLSLGIIISSSFACVVLINYLRTNLQEHFLEIILKAIMTSNKFLIFSYKLFFCISRGKLCQLISSGCED